MQGGPHNHTIGGLTVSLKFAQLPEFKAYQNKVSDVPSWSVLVQFFLLMHFVFPSGEILNKTFLLLS